MCVYQMLQQQKEEVIPWASVRRRYPGGGGGGGFPSHLTEQTPRLGDIHLNSHVQNVTAGVTDMSQKVKYKRQTCKHPIFILKSYNKASDR